MDFFSLIGVVALCCVQGSTLFQIVKFIRSKETAGVSIGFWWVINFGLICYLVYAIHINDWLYMTSNTIGITLSTISIILYYYYKRGEAHHEVDR